MDDGCIPIIDPRTRDAGERWLIDTVHRLAKLAGLPAMPEIGIYESDEVNAFATSPSKSRSLIAVSSGLLRNMTSNEAEGVAGIGEQACLSKQFEKAFRYPAPYVAPFAFSSPTGPKANRSSWRHLGPRFLL